jgi:hypothetical protein
LPKDHVFAFAVTLKSQKPKVKSQKPKAKSQNPKSNVFSKPWDMQAHFEGPG